PVPGPLCGDCCSCSIHPQDRVVGGVNAVEGEWPWQVSLHFSGHLYCAASVITNEWLISAAHCFSRELTNTLKTSFKHRFMNFSYYNARTFDYDVALLQLKKAWPSGLTSYIQPVCLPSPSQALTTNHRCWVTGWGYRSEQDKVLPTVLQKAEVSVLSQSECKRAYDPVSPRMLCAGVPTGEQDACRGDSGGPLSCRVSEGGRWFLTGIVSWGSGCGRPNFPGVYTRVLHEIPSVFHILIMFLTLVLQCPLNSGIFITPFLRGAAFRMIMPLIIKGAHLSHKKVPVLLSVICFVIFDHVHFCLC
uniref:Peptidase S1 domain-containing protein n=1 Tax=Electrophorus electricus TaxID=8005 RepID=A0A4W4FWW3_ELEEL